VCRGLRKDRNDILEQFVLRNKLNLKVKLNLLFQHPFLLSWTQKCMFKGDFILQVWTHPTLESSQENVTEFPALNVMHVQFQVRLSS